MSPFTSKVILCKFLQNIEGKHRKIAIKWLKTLKHMLPLTVHEQMRIADQKIRILQHACIAFYIWFGAMHVFVSTVCVSHMCAMQVGCV